MKIDVTSPPISIFEKAIEGRTCAVKRRENDWVFTFGRCASDGCVLVVESIWRVISDGRIAQGVDDDGQMFGLHVPVDGQSRAPSLIGARTALCASVTPMTADVVVQFDDGVRLDIINVSCGYEAWQAHFRYGEDDVTLVGGGNGQISFVSVPAGSHPRMVVGQPLSNW